MATMLVRGFELEERSAAAHAALLELPGANNTSVFVSPGDIIEVDMDAGFLRGHGTQVVDGQLMATVCGVVERVNKLVSVKPLKTRYSAECGDVVVGRVSEIAQKRWKVDINSKQNAALLLSAVNLPGGVQRRRTNVDELNMRSVFEEGDAISVTCPPVVQYSRQSDRIYLSSSSSEQMSAILFCAEFHFLPSLG
ncbi:hypothetical protein CYMTET_34502 [Cymbomonas tetramitiformis]|uniref:Ribosomal RNA-processing protein 4 n=1 Tax=Cymbomonas tetramitiformis TaxID=36881 RepID=A0AAE0FAT3_9CHLO|nr:hypothetical protein CYMTET_34502 [Cymbomonas tetramitiformis]